MNYQPAKRANDHHCGSHSKRTCPPKSLRDSRSD
jgi:hypothetical protein